MIRSTLVFRFDSVIRESPATGAVTDKRQAFRRPET